MGSIPELGRTPGGQHSHSLQYSCLGRGAWWASVHSVAKTWTQLSNFAHKAHFICNFGDYENMRIFFSMFAT